MEGSFGCPRTVGGYLEAKESQVINDIALAGFLVTYQNLDPWRVTTSGDPYEVEFHFRVSRSELESLKKKLDDDQSCVGIRTYAAMVRQLQRLAATADATGGIWTRP